jgi:hypothetical protein
MVCRLLLLHVVIRIGAVIVCFEEMIRSYDSLLPLNILAVKQLCSAVFKTNTN